jgi:glycosyltransferase involved in cell wall biosynthesis
MKQLGVTMMSTGHQVEIASLDPPRASFLDHSSLPVHALGPTSSNYGFTAKLVPWLRANRAQYDAVVVNGLWQYHSFGAWRALRNSDTPYVLFTHGMLDPWFKRRYPLKHLKKWIYWPWAEYRVLRDARAVLFTCEEERRLARRSFWLYRCNEVVVKGCDLLIKAFAKVLGQEPDWHLVFAGPDQMGWREELNCCASQLGLAQRVTWTGMLSGKMKWGALRAAEIFVLPSHQENFGVAVAEALAAGVPALISNKVNIWREVQGDGAGIVAEDDLEGTCHLLESWLNARELDKQRMRAQAQKCFEKRFEIGRAADSLVAVLSLYSRYQGEHAAC